MADVMPEQQVVDLDGLEGDAPAGTGDLDAVDKQLIDRLVGRAREGGLQLAGEGGLLAQLTKRLVESALDASSPTTWATTATTPRAVTAGTPATATGRRRC
jgi:hypothetical protein